MWCWVDKPAIKRYAYRADPTPNRSSRPPPIPTNKDGRRTTRMSRDATDGSVATVARSDRSKPRGKVKNIERSGKGLAGVLRLVRHVPADRGPAGVSRFPAGARRAVCHRQSSAQWNTVPRFRADAGIRCNHRRLTEPTRGNDSRGIFCSGYRSPIFCCTSNSVFSATAFAFLAPSAITLST